MCLQGLCHPGNVPRRRGSTGLEEGRVWGWAHIVHVPLSQQHPVAAEHPTTPSSGIWQDPCLGRGYSCHQPPAPVPAQAPSAAVPRGREGFRLQLQPQLLLTLLHSSSPSGRVPNSAWIVSRGVAELGSPQAGIAAGAGGEGGGGFPRVLSLSRCPPIPARRGAAAL